MKFQELVCSFMSMYAVPFLVRAAHKNLAVLVHHKCLVLVVLVLVVALYVRYTHRLIYTEIHCQATETGMGILLTLFYYHGI